MPGDRLPGGGRGLDHVQCLVEVLRPAIQIFRLHPLLYAAGLAFHRQHAGAREDRGERLRAAHAAEPAGEDPAAAQIAVVMLAPRLHEGLVGTLHDALRADIDPRTGRHLAVHHQTLAVEFVEMGPVGPVPDEVRIREQHARRVRMGAEDPDGLARLDQERFVVLERAEARDDAVEGLPVARRAADAAIDDEILRALGHLGVEVVHQHPHRRLALPGPATERGAPRRGDAARIVATGRRGHGH